MKPTLTCYLLFILFLLFNSSISIAQTTITGTINDAIEKRPIPGISVTAKVKGSATMLTFALTDEKGQYKLSFKTAADSILITVTGMSIKKQMVTQVNKSDLLDILVSYENITLNEIKVKPPKIRRLDDTLNYDVDQFTGINDRTLGEALKRMPGIKVADNGAISFNGKPINKFYIENQDMLEGRYGIATNNIEAKDVATVQVMENHQPIKALNGKEFTDQAAINIKLKESAKDVLVANAQLGIGGAPLLWNNEAFGMYFGKDKQFMSTYKGNNTGDDSAAELQNFYGGDGNLGFPVGLRIQSPSGPGISRKRYLLNNDNAFSINSLRSLGKDYKLTTNIGYVTDRQIKNSYSRMENYLPGDSTLVIEERIAALERFQYLDGTVKLNANTNEFYLENELRFSGDIQRNEYASVQNAQFIEQNRKAPYFKLSNNLSIIKNYKKINFRINSYNGFGKINDGLDVQPNLYPSLFSSLGQVTGMTQSLSQNVFVTANNVGFGISHGKFKQNYALGANGSIAKLNSALQSKHKNGTLDNAADSLRNNLEWNRIDVFFSPEYSFSNKKINSSLKLPLNYVNQQTNNRIDDIQKSLGRIFFMPSFFASYKLNLLWEVTSSASFSEGIDGLENGFTGYIMQSYRHLVQNEGKLPERSSLSYTLDLRYRHPITELFGSLSGGYFRSNTNLLYGNEFQGFLAVRRTLEIPNSSSGFNVSLDVGKSFDGVFKKLTVNAGYTNSQNVQLNQNVITAFINESFYSGVAVDAKFSEWSDFNYSIGFGQSNYKAKNDSRDFVPIQYLTQNAVLSVFPAKGLIVNIRYDYNYNTAITGSGRIMNFADAGVRYKLKKVEFSVDYNNVFNTRRYIIAAYNGIGSYYASYDLRPTQVLGKVRFKIK